MKVVIIGAGASGLFVAALLAEKGINTIVVEHTDTPGKKILSTGNGKCNMTNFELNENKYYCSDKKFVQDVLSKYNYVDLIGTFMNFGLLTRNRDGYVYPYSEQAISVRETLLNSCYCHGVNIKTNCKVNEIMCEDTGFCINTDDEKIFADKLIICTGGKTFAKSGSDGSGYVLAKKLGHTVNKPVPALTSLICNEKHYKEISGVRVKAKISLYRDKDDSFIAEDGGELQLTDYGISGIPAFNISREVSIRLKNRDRLYGIIDFMPDVSKEEIKSIMFNSRNIYLNRTIEVQLSFLLNKKLAAHILKLSNIDKNLRLSDIRNDNLDNIIHNIKEYKTYIVNTKSFDFAQVTAGGVSVSEINSDTMESKIKDNLYFAGEIIDVDGQCGGYNLHFAWATAYICFCSIIKDLKL